MEAHTERKTTTYIYFTDLKRTTHYNKQPPDRPRYAKPNQGWNSIARTTCTANSRRWAGKAVTPVWATTEMGTCSSRKRTEEAERKEKMLTLEDENKKLHDIVSALQMELHQQRSEVARMTYIAEQERILASSYKTRFWRLKMADLLSARRLETTTGRTSWGSS